MCVLCGHMGRGELRKSCSWEIDADDVTGMHLEREGA